MKKIIAIFISIAAIGAFATEKQFQPRDIQGSFQLTNSHFDKMLPEVIKNFDKISQGPGALILMMYAMRLDVNDTNVNYGMDYKLLYNAVKRPLPEELKGQTREKHLICTSNSDALDFPSTLTLSCTEGSEDEPETEILSCNITYPATNTFNASCREGSDDEESVGGSFTKLEDGNIQIETNDMDDPEEGTFVLKPLIDSDNSADSDEETCSAPQATTADNQFQPKSLLGNWRPSSDEMEQGLEAVKKIGPEALQDSGGLALMFLAMNIEISNSKFLYTMDPANIFKVMEKPAPADFKSGEVETMLNCDWSADKDDAPTSFTANCLDVDDNEKMEVSCTVAYPNACQFSVVCSQSRDDDTMEATFTKQYDGTVKWDMIDSNGNRDDSFNQIVPVKN